MNRIKFFRAFVFTTKTFALNHDKSLEMYFFCVKRQAKKQKKKKKKKKKKKHKKTTFLNTSKAEQLQLKWHIAEKSQFFIGMLNSTLKPCNAPTSFLFTKYLRDLPSTSVSLPDMVIL